MSHVHWVERQRQRLPVLVGGDPALDLCNTWAGWETLDDPGGEWLRSYDVLAGWAGYAGLLDEDEERRLRGRSGAAADRVLADVRRLRTVLHTAVLDPEDRRALAAVTGYVRRAAAELTLRPGDEPAWHVGAGRELELPLLRAGWAAGTLLTSGTLGTVKACPGEDCGWLFLDGRGRRRWCSMSSCGNRAKVRAFAARQR